ncbi:hypothetical protein PS634_05357 [Pseudomonas fluorescens]|nr:hypothetical protein PS634_05357 [Pseudomonas fluorescens]
MIRIDSIWLATEPMDMHAGTETALARAIALCLPKAGAAWGSPTHPDRGGAAGNLRP